MPLVHESYESWFSWATEQVGHHAHEPKLDAVRGVLTSTAFALAKFSTTTRGFAANGAFAALAERLQPDRLETADPAGSQALQDTAIFLLEKLAVTNHKQAVRLAQELIQLGIRDDVFDARLRLFCHQRHEDGAVPDPISTKRGSQVAVWRETVERLNQIKLDGRAAAVQNLAYRLQTACNSPPRRQAA